MQFIVFGFPRQGTDFLMKCIGHMKYHREFFNGLCTMRKYRSEIRSLFGDETLPDKIFVQPSMEMIQSVVGQTWNKTDRQVTKEVFCYTKVPLFKQLGFDMCMMFRRTEHTFPTSKPNYIQPIFSGFINTKQEDFEDPKLQELHAYVTKRNITDSQTQQVLAHVIAWTILLQHAYALNIPVLIYDELMEQTQEQLEDTLKAALYPSFSTADIRTMSAKMVKDRIWDRANREEAFNSQVRPMVQSEYNCVLTELERLNIVPNKVLKRFFVPI